MIEVSGLTVTFGAVRSLESVTLRFPLGVCGLIGPNGAGKTTFLNVVSGFVRPQHGRIEAFGRNLLAMRGYQRARWGVRRTFQTEQGIENLTVRENVQVVQEQARPAKRGQRASEINQALMFTGLEKHSGVLLGELSAGARRRVELARAIVGTPKLLLLDEPAAGLPEDETQQLGEMIRRIPDTYGALTILVDHDLDLLAACCTETAVLDFGSLIAVGKTDEVLRDPRVLNAYLGEEDTGDDA